MEAALIDIDSNKLDKAKDKQEDGMKKLCHKYFLQQKLDLNAYIECIWLRDGKRKWKFCTLSNKLKLLIMLSHLSQ